MSNFCFHLDYYLEAGHSSTSEDRKADELIRKVCEGVLKSLEDGGGRENGVMVRRCEEWLEQERGEGSGENGRLGFGRDTSREA